MPTTDLSSSTRTLQRLTLPTKVHVPACTAIRRGLYVDCETTGKDWARDEVIEIAMLPFRYTLDGRIVEVLEDEAQSYRRDPGRALSAETTALTGLTDDDVRGRHIDVKAASALIERSDLLIAHNARFDRPFCEQVLPATRAKPWGCSRLDVPWLATGCPSDALHCLLCSYGVYARERHRAMADCEAGVWVLSQVLPGTDRPVLAALREQAMKETLRLWAVGIPIGAKDELRGRGYRWMPEVRAGIARSWWTDLGPEMLEPELEWLEETYLTHYDAFRIGFERAHTPIGVVTAWDRWRADPADLARPIGRGEVPVTPRAPVYVPA